MRDYRNEVQDMLGNFFNEHRVMVIPRTQNNIVDLQDTTIGNFKVPVSSNKKYKIEVVNRPSIPDNSKYWKFFEDYLQIKIFLQMSDEFSKNVINGENQNMEIVEGDEELVIGE